MIKTMCTTWIKCPICGGKTRVKIKEDTELRNFPLYCPKCRNETLIDLKLRKYHYHQRARRTDAEPMIDSI